MWSLPKHSGREWPILQNPYLLALPAYTSGDLAAAAGRLRCCLNVPPPPPSDSGLVSLPSTTFIASPPLEADTEDDDVILGSVEADEAPFNVDISTSVSFTFIAACCWLCRTLQSAYRGEKSRRGWLGDTFFSRVLVVALPHTMPN